MNQVWEIFTNHICEALDAFGLQVHAFVLMSNHYHMLATAAGADVDKVMCRLLKGISDEINFRAGRINHVFGGPYKWTLIKSWFQYHHVFRYVYQNPLRAGLCKSPRDYSFSTLENWLSFGILGIPLTSHRFEAPAIRHIRQQGYEDWPSWLNEPYDNEHLDGLRRAIYHREFVFLPHRLTHRIPPLFEFDEEPDVTK